MAQMDEILTMFVEDSCEHLEPIEDALTDMARGGADIDEELVNTVFRVAHSIKAGAGFLNLANIRDLARKLETLLHMIRNREMAPDARSIDRLLAGFDRLRGLVASAATSDREDIAAMLTDLSELAAEHLSPRQLAQAVASVPIALPGGEVVFNENELSLHQALAGGKQLYLVEYDLVHDVQARGKTPLDIIDTMEASGLIVDCRMDLASVGDIDAPPSDRIPFYMLFASIVEPDIVGYLFALKSEAIHPVDLSALPVASEAEAVPEGEAYGPWRLEIIGESARLVLEAGAAPSAGEARQALLACLERGLPVEVSWAGAAGADLALLQVMVSAGESFARRGLTFCHQGGAPESLARLAERAGVTPTDLEAVGLPATTLFAADPPFSR